MLSYRFGYGRGSRFIFLNWFPLIAVPAALIAAYLIAYFYFDTQISDLPSIHWLNHGFEKSGLGFRLGSLANLGTEILSLSVWLMFMTVGWHYAKQVFGCLMVYSHYDGYPLTRNQRNVLKIGLFALALFNFFYFAVYAPEYTENQTERPYFLGVPVIPLGLPTWLIPLGGAVAIVTGLVAVYFVIYRNYVNHRRLPSPNFVVAWLAFYIWWIPPVRQSDFYFLAVPFFHSLQYLPFAYRMERHNAPTGPRRELRLTLRLALLVAMGFVAFEFAPNILDTHLDTAWRFKSWFFLVAFVVSLNVHHFFIDSVVWKFKQPEVREYLLAS